MRRVLLVLALVAAALPSYAKLKLRFEPNAVIVSGVTPGAKALLMDVSLGSSGYRTRVTDRSSVVVDEDADGVVRLAVDDGVKSVSIWAAVDMNTGAYDVDTPAPGHFPHKPLPAAALHRKGNGKPAQIDSDREATVIWCVRPGIGAWKTIVEDGEASDADGRSDGKASAATGSMQRVDGDAGAPDDLKGGDFVFVVDLFALEAFDAQVTN